MKKRELLLLTASVLISAGCAHDEQGDARYQEYPAAIYSSGSGASPATARGQSMGSQSQEKQRLSLTSSRPDQSSSQSGAVNVNVQGSSQADRTLAQQISQELRTDASLTSVISQVNISVAEGNVSLQGAVKTEEQKRQIESTVQRITGVSSVDNQLQVGSNQSIPINP